MDSLIYVIQIGKGVTFAVVFASVRKNFFQLTFVHAGLVQVFDQLKWLWLIRLHRFFNQNPHLLIKFVVENPKPKSCDNQGYSACLISYIQKLRQIETDKNASLLMLLMYQHKPA